MIPSLSRLIVLFLLVAPAGLSGCLDEEVCGASSNDSLAVRFDWDQISLHLLSISYECEMTEREYPIDRYVLSFDLPQIGVVNLQPDGAELSEKLMGSVTFFVDSNGTVALAEPARPHFLINLTRWDPESNGRAEPHVTITHSGDGSRQVPFLPRGDYRHQVLLRNGADATGWLEWSI